VHKRAEAPNRSPITPWPSSAGMSVITRARSSTSGPYQPDPPKWKVPDLCREFVEMLLARAKVIARERHGVEVAGDDLSQLQGTGDHATSLEQASGRFVTAAFVSAREIAGNSEDLFDPESIGSTQVPRSDRIAEIVSRPRFGAPIRIDRAIPESSHALSQPFVERSISWTVLDSPTSSLGEVHAEVHEKRSVRRSSGWLTCFNWTLALGACILLFVVWQLWGTSIAQHHDQHQLQSAFEKSLRAHHSTSPSSSAPSMVPADQSVPVPAEGTPVAQLQIPAIGLDQYVVSGTDEGDLAKGPGHYIGTAAPGQAGNVAIAGHRTTNGAPFNRLGQLAVGNQIYLTTTTGERLTYIVSQAPLAVSPSDVAVLDSFGDNRITLTTCNPEFSSSQRLIVVGELNQPTPPVVKKTKPRAYHIVNSQTASWSWSSLPKVVIEAGFLILLGLTDRRFSAWYGGKGRWLILAPIWITGLFVLFQGLNGFLPTAV
jgi:LPXTG-site transpeptidase (sortase) family protein